MNIKGLEEFFEITLEKDENVLAHEEVLTCHFEKNHLKIQLIANITRNRLWINADPISVLFNATPLIELNVQYDELVFEKYEGIEQGLMFLWKDETQNIYISKLKNGYSFSFSCDPPNKALKLDAKQHAPLN